MNNISNDFVCDNNLKMFVESNLLVEWREEDIEKHHCIVCKRFCGVECDSHGIPTTHGLCMTKNGLYEVHEINDTCSDFELDRNY